MALPFARPSTLAPGFTFSRCTPEDIPQMVSVYVAAFTQTNFVYWWASDLNVMTKWTEARFRLRFRDPRDQQFKIVDDQTGQIVAWARWTVPENLKGLDPGFRLYEDLEEGEFNGPETQYMQNPPPGSKEELYHEFFGGIKGMANKWDSEKKLALQLLCTHPAYHRRGLGAALMKDVLQIADAEGFTTYIEALENAVPVYQRYGFKTVDQLQFDRTKAGLNDTAVVDIMLREPIAV
ncbi:acyl-CoA N-acyltransferase [Truncatella angustata]|uniref:Acyl-CoA N-acyltransferase n=1 Tax=Truncatella angustata TaxID=152316 RepID=A0A9P8UX18_9PEZI|nr:acyl-CoA N-acyltransferase [Truncatella angustata]KAH6659797.1 acyl-CoA N-acyltransferase [Truncatella angustata]